MPHRPKLKNLNSTDAGCSGGPASPKPPFALLCGLSIAVACAVAGVHWPVLSAQALSFDDEKYLFANSTLMHPSWASAGRCLSEVFRSTSVKGYYEPLTLISLMLDVAQGGKSDSLRPFHRTSLTLHVANTMLVIVLLYLLFGDPWPAALVGLLFGLHPLTVEPVTWIWERKTVLATFFTLLALIAYVRYAQCGLRTANSDMKDRNLDLDSQFGIRSSKCPITWYGLTLVFFVLALLSKPTSTPLPMLLLLLDFWPLRRLSWRALAEKLPILVAACLSATVSVVSTARNAQVDFPGEYSIGQTTLRVCYLLVFYLRKMAWPTQLSSAYPLPEPLAISQPTVLIAVLVTCGLAASLLLSLRWSRVLLAGWLFFFVAICPTLGVIRYSWVSASDKYVYLPSVGPLMVLTYILTLIRKSPAFHRRPFILGLSVLGGVLTLVSLEAAETRSYLACWRDSETLFRHMLQVAPEAWMPHYCLGSLLAAQGRTQEAMTHYRRTMQLRPDYAEAYNNLGIMLAEQGLRQEALIHFHKALQLKPDFAEAHNNLASLLVDRGQLDEAIIHCSRALELKPDYTDAHYNLGRALAGQGRTDEAIACYRRVLQLKPNCVEAHANLGLALAGQGHNDEAMVHYRRALQLKPDAADAHNQLGLTLAAAGRVDEAIFHYRRALQLNPEYAEANNNLGNVLAARGSPVEAVAYFQRAVHLKPDYVEAHSNLGNALAAQGLTDEAITRYQQALRLNPNYVEAHNNLGNVLALRGQVEEAISHYRRALQLNPNYLDAHNNLGVVLQRQGRIDEAIVEYREALRINPQHETARARLQSITTSPADPITTRAG